MALSNKIKQVNATMWYLMLECKNKYRDDYVEMFGNQPLNKLSKQQLGDWLAECCAYMWEDFNKIEE